MPVICPTVTAADAHTYRSQIERIEKFAQIIHIDLADGIFAPKLIDVSAIWAPPRAIVDVHLMFNKPLDILDEVLKIKPRLVIVHAEADGDFQKVVETLKAANVKIGVALLASTRLEFIMSGIDLIDHILIFSGKLGQFGGQADLGLLDKVQKIKYMNKNIEVGWDGGINLENVKELANGGVDVLNVGGFIQRSDNPVDAYAKLNLAIMDGH